VSVRPRLGGPLHLLVDRTGLKLSGPGEGRLEKHRTKQRRSWRKFHLGVDAGTGQIGAVELHAPDVDDGSQVGPLLDQILEPVASFTGDGTYDREDVYAAVAARHPEVAVIVHPAPARADRHRCERANPARRPHSDDCRKRRMAWRKASGYNQRAKAEAAINRFKQVIGGRLRAQTGAGQRTEILIGVNALNRMLGFTRRSTFAFVRPATETVFLRRSPPCTTLTRTRVRTPRLVRGVLRGTRPGTTFTGGGSDPRCGASSTALTAR